jgi:hypothetical protein
MTDTREAVDAARKAGIDAVNHILPDDAAQYIGADFLADATINAFLSKLSESHCIVPREMTEAMWDAGAELFPSLEEVEKGIYEHGEDIFYEVIPGPSEIWDAMIQAASAEKE